MLRQNSVLVSLVVLMDRLPWPADPGKRPRGRPKTYSDRLLVKALVIMIIRACTAPMPSWRFSSQTIPCRSSCGRCSTSMGVFRTAAPGSAGWPHSHRPCLG
jgi:hypothetical protein